MRRIGAVWMALVVGACGGAAPEGDAGRVADADAVAAWNGGSVSLADVEARLVGARTPACRASRREGGAVDELVPCYREIAEQLFLEARVAAEHGGAEAAIAARLGEAAEPIGRRILIGTFQQRLQDAVEVSDAEVSAAVDAATAPTPAEQRTLWNLFRRDEDPDHPEATLEFLRGLQARARAGEPFPNLAREYSQSETRLRDGLVGSVQRGRLPRRLEEVAFALPEGGVSDPIRVRGGAVLLYVRNARAARQPSREVALRRARQRLEAERLAQGVQERLAGVTPPQGSLVLEPDALVARLDGDPEAVVLEIGGARMRAAQVRDQVGLRESMRAAELTAPQRDALVTAYQRATESLLLAWNLRTATDAVARAVRAEAAPGIREAQLSAAADAWLSERVAQRVAADPARLRQYYDDNLQQYRSALEFELEVWTLPFGEDPPGQLARMEALRRTLVEGTTTLAAARAELGGHVQKLGWRALDDLPELPGKAHSLLLQTATGSFADPFQEDEALHLVHVIARREPRQRDYDEVAGQVREDYARRFGQALSREVLDAEQASAGFEFFEPRLRSLLAPPAAG